MSDARATAQSGVHTIRLQRSTLGRLNLRTKFVIAFVLIAAMGGIWGGVGLFFVNRSAATILEFTNVTSPLLAESVGLVENAQRMRSALVRALEDDASTADFARQLSTLRSVAEARMAKLRELSLRAGVDIHFDLIEQRERAFSGMLASMLNTAAQRRTAAAGVQERLTQYRASYLRLEPMLTALADLAEGEVMKAEDQSRVQVQTRTATVDGLGDLISSVINDTYPIVHNANRMLRNLHQVDDGVRLLPQHRADHLSETESDFERSFRVFESLTKKLASRLQRGSYPADAAALREGFTELRAIILGPQGLLQHQREVATAAARLASDRRSLDQSEQAYFGILDTVVTVVRRLNENAKAMTAAQIGHASGVIATGVLATIIIGTLVSLLFAHRLTGPLVRLTEQVQHVRDSGELKAVADDSVARRDDEVGILSRNFNLMIADLASARQQLIAKSEAEIDRQYERLNLAINSMPQGLCMFDADQNLIVSNKRYAEIYGLRPAQTVRGTSLGAILQLGEAAQFAGEDAKRLVEQRLEIIARRKPWHEIRELGDGRVISISLVPLPSGGSITTHEDITERRKAEAQIAYMAHHDILTGLPNRARFRTDLQSALDGRREGMVAVLSLDLDHFKNVNDSLGHPVGDALLKAAADRLKSCLRPSDKVARLGGDEFAIVQVGVAQPVGSTALASRLTRELCEPFSADGHQIVIGASIGIALAPNDGVDADRLLKNADLAMYRAKQDGRGVYRFFEPEMDARMQARRALELDLRKALVLKEFEVFYQPLVNVDTGDVSCCEALLRWRKPDREMVPPTEFIPLAEEIGLIHQIGAWVLLQACTEAQRWPSNIRVAVNLSATQFKAGNVVEDVFTALRISGLSPHRLELEITESALLSDTKVTLTALHKFRDAGIRIAMDDFGTGYSSLGYLRKFPFDRIKIDQSFISDLPEKPDSVAILRAVAGLGNTLGITTTAEGVASEAQLRQVRQEGCKEAQGYLFSKPMAAADIERMLAQHSPYITAPV